MEPDPIRRAFDDYVRKVGLREDPKYCSFVDFTAGAKWAARESAKMCDEDGYRHLADKIRKHFGVEN
jgi:hypothetical protein